MLFKTFFNGLASMIYPDICHVCGVSLVKGESVLCLQCLDRLPRTDISTLRFNELHKRLAAPAIPIERAGGWFYYYRDNEYASLIRDAKYNGRPELSAWTGRQCAAELLPTGFFDGIDLILPVPMHPVKRFIRGYNQTQLISQAIGEVTGIAVGDHLRSLSMHSTQTRKSATERIINAGGEYKALATSRGVNLKGKHVLIIDDVITTGATILANCRAVLDAEADVTLSVLSIGVSHLRQG